MTRNKIAFRWYTPKFVTSFFSWLFSLNLTSQKDSTRTFFSEKEGHFFVWIVYEFVNAVNQQSPKNQFSTEAF